MRILISFLLFVSISASAQQNVIIRGKAEPYKGSLLTFYRYNDLVNFTETIIGYANVDSAGNFAIQYQLKQTEPITIRTDNIRTSFYSSPGKEYKLTIYPKDSAATETFSIDIPVRNTIIADSTDLNSVKVNIDENIEAFFKKNIELFYKKAAKAKVDSFKIAIRKQYQEVSDPYILSYLNYSLAPIDEASFKRKEVLFQEYFSGPVMYHNYEYMMYFHQFFKQHFAMMSISAKGMPLLDELNNNRSHNGLMEKIYQADTLLKNDTLRELVLIKGLGEIYYMSSTKKQNVEIVLNTITTKGLTEYSREAAKHMLASFNKLKVGNPAPNFSLEDINGKEVRLDQFKGKYVYLEFWATWCNPCIQELKLMARMHEKYKDDVVFISVSLDKDFDDVKSFLKKNPKYNWTFLNYASNKKVRDDYNVKALPVYYLIDPQGDLIKSPALRPSENVESIFMDISKRK